MTYIAVTQGTAGWLLSNSELLERIATDLINDAFNGVDKADFFEGPLRVSGALGNELIAIWNTDYLGTSGDEPWGFINLSPKNGIASERSISIGVFERALYVLNQRLRGLALEGVIHRFWDDERVHTCLAGSGGLAYKYSLAYVEAEIKGINRVLVTGPMHDYLQLRRSCSAERIHLDGMVVSANALIHPVKARPVMDSSVLAELRKLITRPQVFSDQDLFGMQSTELSADLDRGYSRSHYELTYEDWMQQNSPLSRDQRRIVQANILRHHPLRLRGAAGSGKTHLMLLLAMKQLRDDASKAIKVLYITHNAAMSQSIKDRFELLGGSEDLSNGRLNVMTLAEYGTEQLNIEFSSIIDVDADKTKKYQLDSVETALRNQLNIAAPLYENSVFISQARLDDSFFRIFARLIAAEISVAIKGWSLEDDSQRYIYSSRQFSRLHGILSEDERAFVFAVFRLYHEEVFEQNQVLDSDDIAISLYGRLRTPLWQLRRRTEAYDFVFVDECQLFNANEKRVFHYLTKGDKQYVPIALALDQAQDLMGQTAGLGAFGIDSVESEDLKGGHRSTIEIMRLAFHVISKTSDLFSVDEYPDFTADPESFVSSVHPAAQSPRFVKWQAADVPNSILSTVSAIRSGLIRRIAIVILSDDYDALSKKLRDLDSSIIELERRGDLSSSDAPMTILTKPAYVGGMEFDAVIAIGLEQGVTPSRVKAAEALSFAVTQQAYREMYLTFSRARYQLYVGIRGRVEPTEVLQEARAAGLIAWQ